ncbi:MAG TPA: hypothetical protein VK853_06530 [Ilumatobacteraceae bacterium]|nr:hypothetical protein [Ilumatobacteraceae bacterium]
MDARYDLQRVRALGHRTIDAIAELDRLAAGDAVSDPLAGEALRAIRLTRQNLDDHWMPAIQAIEQSEAMVSWTGTGVVVDLAGRVGLSAASGIRSCVWTPLSSLSDDELVAHVEWLDRQAAPAPADRDILAMELASRVTNDVAFGERLATASAVLPIVGLLVASAPFPVTFVSALVRAMMWPHGPQATADLQGYAHSLSAALAVLAEHPGASLDLLLDPVGLFGLASWERLDVAAVAGVVVSGLHSAVQADPDRLADGYAVLAQLTELANLQLDRGVNPGMAIGVAGSMAGYVPTLAPALGFEGSRRVVVDATGTDVDLGSYDDLVGLFGVLLREPAAQAAIGPVVSEYAIATVTDLGADVATRTGVEHVADLADLLVDATRGEEAALMAEALADEQRRRQFAGLLGFTATTIATLSGAGAVIRSVVAAAVRLGTELAPRVEVQQMPPNLFGPTTYDIITMGAVAVVVDDPRVRRRLGLASIPPRHLREIADRLREIDDETDLHARSVRVDRLERWIATEVPLLDAHLNAVKRIPGMDALKE